MAMGEKSAMKNATFDDPGQADWIKQRQLREIEMLRQTKKQQIISELMGNYMADSIMVHVVPGKIAFVSLKVENNTQSPQVYSVNIQDPDEHFTEDKEVQMVFSPKELEYWVKKGKVKRPASYECITKSDTVMLSPNQSVELLFKFQTHRDVDLSPNAIANAEYIKPRLVKIQVVSTPGNDEQIYNCNVTPIYPPIDHTFRYFEPEHSYFRVRIPPFLQFNQPQLNIKVNKPTVQAILDDKARELNIQSKTGAALQNQNIIFFIYADDLRNELLATCKVDVTPLQCIYSQTMAGVQNSLTLAMPTREARMIEIYSSQPQNVYLPKKNINNQIRVLPNQTYHVPVHVKTYTPDQQRVIVNAIDYSTGNLSHSWLVILESRHPSIDERQTIRARVGIMTNKGVMFQNKARMDLMYEFTSSRPDLMEPTRRLVSFKANSNQEIELNIHPQR